MVLGAMTDKPICHYCNKPGHYKRDCYKWQRDQGIVCGGGNGSRGSYGRGSSSGGRSGNGYGRGRNGNVLNSVE